MLVYVIKSVIVLSALYCIFFALLSKETFHKLNRITLLGSMIISLLLPAIPHSFELPFVQKENTYITMQVGEAVRVNDIALPQEEINRIDVSVVMQMIEYLYLAVLGIMTCLMLYRLILTILYITSGGLRHTDAQGNTVVLKAGQQSSFSFLHYIIMSTEDYEKNREAILIHEQEHIRLKHTYDLMLFEVVKTIQWFNPLAWMLGRDLKNIHEYQADQAVIQQGIDATNYQYLLVSKSAGPAAFAMTNGFSHSQLKSRIIMLNKKNSRPVATLRYLALIPMAFLAFVLTAHAKNTSDPTTTTTSKEKRTYQGLVIDAETKAPIYGATIIIEGTTKGTVSGKKGDFSVMATPGQVLSVSFVGFTSRRFILPETISTGIVIPLKKEMVELEEIVVVSYAPKEIIPQEEVDLDNVDDTAFIAVEEMPEFPGGMMECMKFLAQNVKYPTICMEKMIEGRVIVSFTVNTDGSLTDIQEENSPNEELTEEAIRVCKLMPNWKPAKQRGQAVKVRYTIPITFRLQ